MCKVSVGSVSKILLMLTQSLYLVQYKRSTLTSTDDFLVTTGRTIIVISQVHNHICTYVCHSITRACRLLGHVTVLFPYD